MHDCIEVSIIDTAIVMSFLARVNAFGKLFDHLCVERRDIVRLAAGDDALIDDHLLVDPMTARISDVGLQ